MLSDRLATRRDLVFGQRRVELCRTTRLCVLCRLLEKSVRIETTRKRLIAKIVESRRHLLALCVNRNDLLIRAKGAKLTWTMIQITRPLRCHVAIANSEGLDNAAVVQDRLPTRGIPMLELSQVLPKRPALHAVGAAERDDCFQEWKMLKLSTFVEHEQRLLIGNEPAPRDGFQQCSDPEFHDGSMATQFIGRDDQVDRNRLPLDNVLQLEGRLFECTNHAIAEDRFEIGIAKSPTPSHPPSKSTVSAALSRIATSTTSNGT